MSAPLDGLSNPAAGDNGGQTMINVQSPDAQAAHPTALADVLAYDAACQRRALRGIGCAAWMRLDAALMQLQDEYPEQHFGICGETYTSQVVMRAMDLAYPTRDVTFRKLLLTAAERDSGNLQSARLQELREEFGPDARLFVEGVISSKHWHEHWGVDENYSHSNDEWMHAVGVNLAVNEWYEKQGFSNKGHTEEKYFVEHSNARMKRLPILFGEDNQAAYRSQPMGEGCHGRYFRSISKIFVFCPTKAPGSIYNSRKRKSGVR